MALDKPLVLKTRKSFNNWVPVAQGVDFLVVNLTESHEEKVQALSLKHALAKVRIEDEAKLKTLMHEVAKLYLRCVVKDFRGIKDEAGNEVKYISDGDMWNFEQAWNILLHNLTDTMAVYDIVSDELDFNEAEKKS